MRILFMGTPDFSVPVLQQLIDDHYTIVAVVTQPDRPKGRKKVLTPPPVKQCAMEHDIPVLQPKRVRNPEAIQQILDCQPDLVVTAAYGQILPQEILDIPPLGCINVHASLLPEYRGGAPIHQAIIDGKKETGVTIMYMVKQLDAGDILTQVKIPIGESDNVGTLHNKLSYAGAKLLSETIPKLEKGEITPTPQDEGRVTFAPTISREDEKIDWHSDGEAIYNKVRGLNPFPGAYTMLQGNVLKLWQTEKVHETSNDQPGTITAVLEDGFIVKTGDSHAIKIKECQPSGKRKMAAEQFLRGTTLEPGMILGE